MEGYFPHSLETVMNMDAVREWLQRQPFQPFVMVLSIFCHESPIARAMVGWCENHRHRVRITNVISLGELLH
jgi:hypothetical protein